MEVIAAKVGGDLQIKFKGSPPFYSCTVDICPVCSIKCINSTSVFVFSLDCVCL